MKLKFQKWAEEKEKSLYSELFDSTSIMAKMPENGQWIPELSNYCTFRFSVPSDPKKLCDGQPCYMVTLNNGTISFEHDETQYQKRNNENLKTSFEILNSVLWAVGQYVKEIKPSTLNWSSITESDSKNPKARQKIYFAWAAKHLYPEYLPSSKETWDHPNSFKEDKNLTDEEMQQVLEVSKEVNAYDFLNDIIPLIRNKTTEPLLLTNTARERMAAKIKEYTDDPQINPYQLEKGSKVRFDLDKELDIKRWLNKKYYSFNAFTGKGEIANFYLSKNQETEDPTLEERTHSLFAKVEFSDYLGSSGRQTSEEFIVPINFLVLQSPEYDARLRKRFEDLLNDKELNPNGIKEGDNVISIHAVNVKGKITEDWEYKYTGLLGQVRKVEENLDSIFPSLKFYINWNDEAKTILGSYSDNVSIKDPHKLMIDNPENRLKITTLKRHYEIEQQLKKNSKLIQKRTLNDKTQVKETPEDILNDPQNPQKLKIGDFVIYRQFENSIPIYAQIANMERATYSSNIIVSLKMDRRKRLKTVWGTENLTKNTSPAILARQNKMQQTQQRRIALTNALTQYNLNIGDYVTILQGVHKNKEGKILNFLQNGQKISATVGSYPQGNFNIDIRFLRKETPVSLESLRFLNFMKKINEKFES